MLWCFVFLDFQSKIQKDIGSKEGSFGVEFHQFADSRLNTFKANMENTPLLLQQLKWPLL